MTTELNKIKFAVRPSKFDNRDFLYTEQKRSKVDLREWASPVESQNDLGSCVGNAIANAYELLLNRLYPEKFTDLSRLFIYYNARYLEGTTEQDVGTYIRSGLKGVKTYGVCSEEIWKYDIKKFNVAPSNEAYLDAGNRKISTYTRLLTCDDAVESINNNVPVVIGLDVYDNFLEISKADPVVKMPTMNNMLLGGHAMSLEGYDLDTKMFLAKNSFGVDWGLDGYCWIPFDYISYYIWDMWNFDIYLEDK